MSIKIEVTGNSLAEVADKLLALAGQFQTTPWVEAAPGGDAAPAAEKAKPSRKKPNAETKAAMRELQQGGQEFDSVDALMEDLNKDGEGNAASSAETSSQTTKSDTSSPSAETAKSPSEALDFDKDVAPVVIEAVQRTSREVVSETLSEFGAARASEVDEKLWPEMLERLKAL